MISMHVKLRWGQFDASMCACHVAEVLAEEENRWDGELCSRPVKLRDFWVWGYQTQLDTRHQSTGTLQELKHTFVINQWLHCILSHWRTWEAQEESDFEKD